MFRFCKSLWEDALPKLLQSFWLFFGYVLSQVGVQAINMVTGFLIIRNMAKDDYANYTIINTLGPVMLMLSDNGIVTAISAIGRHIWQDDEKTGSLVNTALPLRRKFALVSFVLVSPLLAWMLYRNHAPVSTIVLLTLITLAGVFFQLTGAVMLVILQLRQQIKTLVKVSVASALLRMTLVAAFILFFQISAFLAILAATCSFVLEAFILVRAVKPQIHWQAPPNPEYRTTIFSLVKKTMPLTVYFCIQGQVSIWLMSIFGSSHQVADVGAAMRLGVIFSTLTSAYGAIAVPRFTRSNGRRLLFKKLIQILCSQSLILVICTTFIKLFPAPFIMLLGAKYANMTNIIWLVVLSSGLISLTGTVFSLNMSKGWIPPAIVTIPVEIVTQIVLLLSLDLSKTSSVLIFSGLSTIPPTIVNTIMLLRRIRMEPE